MGLVTPTQISDATTADAADVNTPINQLANEFNGNIDNANIKTAAAIATSKLANDAGITGAKIAPGAIELGYAERVSGNFLPGTTAETDVSGVSVAVTVPSGGRSIKITAQMTVYNTGGADTITLKIKEGSTVLGTARQYTSALNITNTKTFSARVSAPTAGAHTYKVSIAGGVASPAIQAGSTEPAYILVEAI